MRELEKLSHFKYYFHIIITKLTIKLLTYSSCKSKIRKKNHSLCVSLTSYYAFSLVTAYLVIPFVLLGTKWNEIVAKKFALNLKLPVAKWILSTGKKNNLNENNLLLITKLTTKSYLQFISPKRTIQSKH